MTEHDLDQRVRLATFEFLRRVTREMGETLPFDLLRRGFEFEGRRVPLISAQGIFKPAILPEMPLTIFTAPLVEGKARPYDDEVAADGFIIYRYQRHGADYRDNVGLRLAMQRRAPLVYLYGVVKGWYRPTWPVFVVHDDPWRKDPDARVAPHVSKGRRGLRVGTEKAAGGAGRRTSAATVIDAAERRADGLAPRSRRSGRPSSRATSP